jgi:NADP-reducing hydrogenase subunit HndB
MGEQPKTTYGKVTPEVAARIMKEHVENGNIVQSNVIQL